MIKTGKTTIVKEGDPPLSFKFLREKGYIMKFLDNISLILVIIGALNWGSVGLFGLDLVGYLFGGQLSVASRIIFALVGLAGLWCITLLFKDKVPPSEHRH